MANKRLAKIKDKKVDADADGEGNIVVELERKQRIDVEDFEVYKRSLGPTEKSTGCNGNQEGSMSDESDE